MQGKLPKKFDSSVQAAFLAVVEQGATRTDAARRVGVSTTTVRQAIKIGLDEHGQPLPDSFAASLKEIELECVEAIESKLYEAAAKGEPWAIQMWLKGKAKDVWADKPGPLVNVNTGNTLVVEGTPDERRRTITALAAELDSRRAAITVTASPRGEPEDSPSHPSPLTLPDLDADGEQAPVH